MRSLARHPLLVFFLLAFGLTWVVWVPRAVGVPVGIVGQLSTWIPAAAAVLAAALTGGRAAVRRLLAALVRWRVGWWWYALVILGPAAFAAVVAAAYVLLGGSWTTAFPAAATGVGSLAFFLVMLTLTDGVGEEVAWRGFALPRLLERYSALIASVVLGLLWGLWHLPLLFTEGMGLFGHPVWLLLADIMAKSILFTWVFLRTRGSVLIAALLHGTTNLFMMSPPLTQSGDLLLPLLSLGAKWLLVAVIVLVCGPALIRRERSDQAAESLT
ncbi:MAG TPA: CPBP family intramembrane glutamic endopeptidase [Propionibacteriaceae bacterium]|nr:CPBP family intramembrane glutamic endopeptidase [Propionibacteriaceae bacterium]